MQIRSRHLRKPKFMQAERVATMNVVQDRERFRWDSQRRQTRVVELSRLDGVRFITATHADQSGRISRFSSCLQIPSNTLTVSANPAGTTEVAVASNSDFAPGDYVVINSSPPVVRKVEKLGSLIFEAPLPIMVEGGTSIVAVDPPGGDRLSPVIRISSPLEGASFGPGAVVPLRVSCSDPGVGVEACEFPATLDTSRPGRQTVTLKAWDRNGNMRIQLFSYEVNAASPARPLLEPSAGVQNAPVALTFAPASVVVASQTTTSVQLGQLTAAVNSPASASGEVPISGASPSLSGSAEAALASESFGANPLIGAPASAGPTSEVAYTGGSSRNQSAIGLALFAIGGAFIVGARKRRRRLT
jgi:hypothetical protein